MKKTALQIADTVSTKPDALGALQTAAPWLTAAGAGALGYGLLRQKKFAPIGTQLRSLQEATKGKTFRIATNPASTFAQRIRRMVFGSPVINTGDEVGGTVLHHTASPKGGGDININAGGITDALFDKLTFDRVMRQGVGTGAGRAASLPNTMRLDEALKQVGGDPQRLKEIFPDFMLKARNESMGRGIFSSLEDKGVNEALQNPSQFIFQEKMPIKNEFRVHTIDNEPFTATHRFMPNKVLRGLWNRIAGGGGGAFVPLMGKKRKALHEFIRQSTAHLKPADGKSLSDVGESMHVAWDVAELPDGTFKLIEANPVPGTLMNPITARKLRRQITGNWSHPISALGGAALAVPTGLLTNEAMNRFVPKREAVMKKTAQEISQNVLLKLAIREGNPEVWRRLVNIVAKAKGYPPPTDAEFNEMFPPDWETKHPHTEAAIHESPWFKRNLENQVGTNQARNYTGYQEPTSPEEAAEYANAVNNAENAARAQHEELLNALQAGAQINTGLGALSAFGTATTTAAGLQSARQAKTPEERYAILGLGGSLAGLSGGEAFHRFRQAGWANEFRKMLSNPTNVDVDRFSQLANKVMAPPSYLKPRYVGGLAGLGLGLGGAALWNALAKNKAMDKAASITPKEIALGLTGTAARPEITQDEIIELGNKLKEEELVKQKWEPVKKGIGGSVLGAVFGRLSPRTQRFGKLPGTLLGAGIGAGVGSLSGVLDRYLSGNLAEGKGQILGRAARSGRLHRGEIGVYGAHEFAPYAIGTQPGGTSLSSEEIQNIRNKILKHNIASGVAVSTPAAIVAGLMTHKFKAPTSSVVDAVGATLLGGAGAGAFSAPYKSNTVADLYSRGYGRLAKKIENE
jgi:hypothetical protein